MTAKMLDEFLLGGISSSRKILQSACMRIACGYMAAAGILCIAHHTIQFVVPDYDIRLAIKDVSREVLIPLVSNPLRLSSKGIMLTESTGPFYFVLRMRSYLRYCMNLRRLYTRVATASIVSQVD